jgi:mannose-6-phosphate isomerase
MSLKHALQLTPEFRDYVWGGERLRPGVYPTAEAWAIYENDRVASGPLAGRSLAEVAAAEGLALLGERVVQLTGARFPLLIKLLDCAQWLSLQVHPNDEQAVKLEGPGFFGKTEAWHVLDAAPEARLIAGIKAGTSPEALADAIRNGTILEVAETIDVHTGDSVFMRAGTVHALGPGLLIYEVQQTSDLTYRVFDWNRPQTGRRVLHIEKSLVVANPNARAAAHPCPTLPDAGRAVVVACPYFTLEVLCAHSRAVDLDTQGQTFHALTVIEGSAQLVIVDQVLTLNRYESAVIPADVGPYAVRPLGSCRVLKSSVEQV